MLEAFPITILEKQKLPLLQSSKPGVWITPKVEVEGGECDWCGLKVDARIKCSVQESPKYIKICDECIKLARKISISSFRIRPNHIALIANERRKRFYASQVQGESGQTADSN